MSIMKPGMCGLLSTLSFGTILTLFSALTLQIKYQFYFHCLLKNDNHS